MVASTMTPSRFGTTFNGAQSIYGSSTASAADSLPSIDFGFRDLRERMAQFTVRFDDFIARGRQRVLDERNRFRMNVAELEDTQRATKAQIVELESKSSSHAQTLAKEAAEANEMEIVIQELAAQKEEHVARRDELKEEIASVQASIKQKREAQIAHQRALESQARHNVPELRFWEHCLGMRIEGSGSGVVDQLRFVFVGLERKDVAQEAWFELFMGGKEYKVAASKPKLDHDAVEEVLERLHGSNELGLFLKGMRALLSEALKS